MYIKNGGQFLVDRHSFFVSPSSLAPHLHLCYTKSNTFGAYMSRVAFLDNPDYAINGGAGLKRKNRCILLSVCMVFGLLSGCARKNEVVTYEDTNREEVTITYFGNKYEPENVRVIEEIISGFMSKTPGIHVSYESLKGAGYFDALRKRLSCGKGDDVFMVNHDTLLELEQNSQVADLSGLESISNYTDAMLGQMTEENGAIYWVPTTVSVFGLYCNLDLLKEHGQAVPQSIGEWEQTCDYFVKQGITPIVANNDISLKTMAIGLGFYQVYQEGRQAEVFEALNSGKERLSSYLRPGFALVSDFIERGYIDAKTALITEKTSDDLAQFVQGKSPFMLTGAWATVRLKELSPDFSFEVAPLPLLEDGALLVINADTRLSVSADSDQLDTAMEFVEYFTKPENIQQFADQQSSFSPLKSGSVSSVKEIQPLLPCYEAGRTVIGTDGMLDLPIWDLTAEVCQKLLSGEALNAVMTWLDEQTEGGAQP